jgi:hypothetical protein
MPTPPGPRAGSCSQSKVQFQKPWQTPAYNVLLSPKKGQGRDSYATQIDELLLQPPQQQRIMQPWAR